MVESQVNEEGRVSFVAKLNIFGMGKKAPWVESLYTAGYKKINLDEIKTQFEVVEFCLTQVCADNELGALLQGLDGEYILPGPGGDPIRNPDVLPTGKNMHAEADEPLEMNFIRKHALVQAEEMGINLRQASTRVFSNASGSYSSNINLAVENGTWENEAELQEMYLGRKSFAFSADNPGTMEQSRKIFETTLKTAEVTFQNLDSSEISLTDVSHYYDSDPTKIVANLRTDGKKPTSFIADTTTANAQVRTLSETVRLDARTKLLNPKWYEGMLSHGYEGVRELSKRLVNTSGWSATAGAVDNWIYEETNDTFIKDEEMCKRLMNLNPNSFRKIVSTLLEVNGRGYWETSDENLDKLREMYQEVEDRIEGVD